MSTHRRRIGLGYDSNKALGRDLNSVWDDSVEEKTVEETVKWIEACDDTRREVAEGLETEDWIVIGKKKLIIDDETDFIDPNLLAGMLQAKTIFEQLSGRKRREARTRANPYEKKVIGSAFFQNHAAMKAANMDKVFNWIFSQENEKNILLKNPLMPEQQAKNTDREADMFYFADVCAGPGGFSEYMLWRKGFYNCKGFGFTLRGKDDFQLHQFRAACPHFFEPFYGAVGDGDVMNPENIDALEEFIMRGTNGEGVHLMMADGGFYVEGQENIQEILSKRLYLCQLLVSLCIVREGGNFFCKLFDIFTPFSEVRSSHTWKKDVNAVQVADDTDVERRSVYEKVSIHKPHTSRPDNSERYIICEGLRREDSVIVKEYLKRVNRKLDELTMAESDDDIVSIVPMEKIKKDEAFTDYIIKCNDKLAYRKTVYLQKYLSYAKNQIQIKKGQGNLRDKCLQYWMIPNRVKDNNRRPMINVQPVLDEAFANHKRRALMLGDHDYALSAVALNTHLHLTANQEKWLQYAEYECVFLCERTCHPSLLVSTGDTVFIYGRNGWESKDTKYYRIPAKTIRLVEETRSYVEKDGANRRQLEPDGNLIRILDAGMLNGDDVSELFYDERMKAAEKMCRALAKVENRVLEWRGIVYMPHVIVTADHFPLCDVNTVRGNLSLTRYQGEEVALYEENGRKIFVRGMRGSNCINNELWRLAWSRNERKPYAFHSGRNQSFYKKDWVPHQCHSSFWCTAVMKYNLMHHPEGKDKEYRFMKLSAWIWKWNPSPTGNYGPRAILEEKTSNEGFTLMSISDYYVKTDMRLGKTPMAGMAFAASPEEVEMHCEICCKKHLLSACVRCHESGRRPTDESHFVCASCVKKRWLVKGLKVLRDNSGLYCLAPNCPRIVDKEVLAKAMKNHSMMGPWMLNLSFATVK